VSFSSCRRGCARVHLTFVHTVFKNISIRARLALTVSFLSLLLVIGGAMGIAGVSMSNSISNSIVK
jgi:hypothetical protein